MWYENNNRNIFVILYKKMRTLNYWNGYLEIIDAQNNSIIGIHNIQNYWLILCKKFYGINLWNLADMKGAASKILNMKKKEKLISILANEGT